MIDKKRKKDLDEFAEEYSLDGLTSSEIDSFRAGWNAGFIYGRSSK